MTKKLQLLLLLAATVCGMSAYAAPGGSWTTIEHLAYPTPQNLMAELDGSKVKLSWDGVQWPADGFPEEIDGKTVPTDFTYSIECRTKTTGTDTWSNWWERTSRGRLDDNGVFVSRWEINDEGIESGKTYQYRIRCYSYIQPDNPQDLTNPTRDGYFSEYSETVTAYRTLDKLEISLDKNIRFSPSLRGGPGIDIEYVYTSSRKAEGEKPLFFTFKAIEIPYPEPGTTPEAPVEGGKPYYRTDGTPLDVKLLYVSPPNIAEEVNPTNFTLTASDDLEDGDEREISWYPGNDLENYYHTDVTIWIQGWEPSETAGGEPRLVLDERIGNVTIDTRTIEAGPNPEQDGVLLTWPSIPNAVKYEIWRTPDVGDDYLLGTTTETSYTDMTVSAGEVYHYEVKAFDANGDEIDSGYAAGYSRLDAFSTKEQSLYSVEPQTPWNGKVDIVVRYHSARDVRDDGIPYFKLIAENYETGETLNVKTLIRADGEVLDPNGFTLEDEQNLEQRLVWDAGKDLGDTLIERLRLTVDCAGIKPLWEGYPTTAWTGSPAKYKENVRLDTRSPRIRKLGQGTHAYIDLDWFPGATKADLYCNGKLIHTTTDEYTRYKTLDNEELNIWGVNELKLVPDKGDTWVGYIAYPAFDFTVTKGVADAITLTWNTVDDTAVGGYKILRREKGSTTDFDTLAVMAVDVTTYTDNTAEEATLYEYTVVPQHTWDENIGPVPATKEGYRTLEKIEFVQARQFYPWSTRVAIDIYYKSARQSSTDGEVTYALKAKMADGTEIPIDSRNLTLETVDGLHLLPTDLPFGSKSLPSGATTRLWWNAPADLTVPLSSSVLSGITLQLVPTLAEGAPAGAKPAPATVTSAGITVDLRTKRTVAYGEQIPVVWEWWRTDGRVEAHDKNVFYVKPEGSETNGTMVWHTPEHSGEGTIEVPENEDLWPSFRLVKREMNTDDTDETKQITLTSEVLFQMPVAAPQNVQATKGNPYTVTVTWDEVPYATGYQLEILTVGDRGQTTRYTKYVFDGTRYVDTQAPDPGIVRYIVRARYQNGTTGDPSEPVIGWLSIDKAGLTNLSTRQPWNGTVDIDIDYRTVRDKYAKATGGADNLPDKTITIAVITADGEAFAVQSLIKETLEGDIIRRKNVTNGAFTIGPNDRIIWDAPTDAPRMHEPNSTLKVTFKGDEYSTPIVLERTFDLDTRLGVIELPFSTESVQIPWSTRWAKPGADDLGLKDNWYRQTAVLTDVTDSENPTEIMRTEEIMLGWETVTSWTPKKWGMNTIQLILSPSSGDNERTEYATIFIVVPEFDFTVTKGAADGITLTWDMKDKNAAVGYQILRREQGSAANFDTLATVEADVATWTDQTAKDATIYEYIVLPRHSWDKKTTIIPAAKEGYRTLDKVEIVQARQLYPWEMQVPMEIYYKSVREKATDGKVKYSMEAATADGIAIALNTLRLKTKNGTSIDATDIPFGSSAIPSGDTIRLWWDAGTDIGMDTVISNAVLRIVPTLAEGAPEGAQPASATVTSADFTIDTRTVRPVTLGEKIPITWEWTRTDQRDETQDYTGIYAQRQSGATGEYEILRPETNTGTGIIEVTEDLLSWSGFRLIKREMNHGTSAAEEKTLTSTVLFQLPSTQPQNVQATQGDTTGVTVTWDAVPYATSYEVTIEGWDVAINRTIRIDTTEETRFVDKGLPRPGLGRYTVKAIYSNNKTGKASEPAIGYAVLETMRLRGISTRWPWNGKVDIDIEYKTVRPRFQELFGLPDLPYPDNVTLTARTADGKSLPMRTLDKEPAVDRNYTVNRKVVQNGTAIFSGSGWLRIVWDADTDTLGINAQGTTITLTASDDYARNIDSTTVDVNTTKPEFIPLTEKDTVVSFPWAARWANEASRSLNMQDGTDIQIRVITRYGTDTTLVFDEEQLSDEDGIFRWKTNDAFGVIPVVALDSNRATAEKTVYKSKFLRYITKTPVTVELHSAGDALNIWWTGSGDCTYYQVIRREVYRDGTRGNWGNMAPVSTYETDMWGYPAGTGRYIDIGIVGGKTYEYAVLPLYPDPDTHDYITAPVTDSTFWSAGRVPVGITLDVQPAGQSSIALTWTDITDAYSYDIYRDNGDGQYQKITNVPYTATTFTDKDVRSGKRYHYKVAALNWEKKTLETSEPATGRIAVGIVINVQDVDVNSVSLSWTEVPDADSYDILRDNGDGQFLKTGNVPASAGTTFTDRNVESGTHYKYEIAAVDSEGNTLEKSSPMSVRVPVVIVLHVESLDRIDISLSWTKVADADSYDVYRDNGDGQFLKIGNIPASTGTTFTDTDAESVKRYRYKVASLDSEGNILDTSAPATGYTQLDGISINRIEPRFPWNGLVDVLVSYKSARDRQEDGIPHFQIVATSGKDTLAMKTLTLAYAATLNQKDFTLADDGSEQRLVWDARTDLGATNYPEGLILTVSCVRIEPYQETASVKAFEGEPNSGGFIPFDLRRIPEVRLGIPTNIYADLAWFTGATRLEVIVNGESVFTTTDGNNYYCTLGKEQLNIWGTNTLKLKSDNGIEQTAQIKYPDFVFSATKGNRDSIIVEWNRLDYISAYSIRRRAANSGDAFVEVALVQDTTRWADTSEETIIGEFEYIIMPLLAHNEDAGPQPAPVTGYRALDLARLITIEPADGGNVTADKAMARYGETVTLTVTPAIGYELDLLTVKDGDEEVSVAETEGNYTFVMPAGNVVVSATFEYTGTAIKTVEDTDIAPYKIIRDGIVYIIRGGKTYTVTGVEVK